MHPGLHYPPSSGWRAVVTSRYDISIIARGDNNDVPRENYGIVKVNSPTSDPCHCNSNTNYLFFQRPWTRIRHTGMNFARGPSIRISNVRTTGFGGAFVGSTATSFLRTPFLVTVFLGTLFSDRETITSGGAGGGGGGASRGGSG
jgi:hypothetical protein